MSQAPSDETAAIALEYHDELLASIDLPSGKLNIVRGLGSGLGSRCGDPEGTFWAIGDRGPNIKVKDAVGNLGLDQLAAHLGHDGAKIMPCVEIGPAISELRLEGNNVVLLRTFPLRDRSGKPLWGLPTPGSPGALTEPAFTLSGDRIPGDPSGADTEGIAACADGTFFVGDEYGPSLLRVAADGHVLVRWVPARLEPLFHQTNYPVVGALPAIASKRRLNRGFEGLALSPDGGSLYLAFQSPLAHPDEQAHRTATHVRFWLLDIASGEVAAQYLYPLDDPSSFRRDVERGPVVCSHIKVSELAVIGPDHLLVLERGSQTTKLYAVRLDEGSVLEREHLDVAQAPTIEQLSATGDLNHSVPILRKSLVLSTDNHPQISADLEGMIVLSPSSVLLVNDNDFGVESVETKFWKIDFSTDVTSQQKSDSAYKRFDDEAPELNSPAG